MRSTRYMPLVCVTSAVVLLSACERAPAADPLADHPQFSNNGPSLLVCPATQEQSYTGVIGTTGGTLATDGVRITVPAGAVGEDTEFTLRVPASPYVLVEITANGVEHYQFAGPVSVAIDYRRCTNGAPPTLSVWYIDAATGALLENMGGVDDRGSKRIVFSTTHLSQYVIAD